MSSETHAGIGDKIMLVGIDNKQIVEKRLQAAGWRVVKVFDDEAALNHARHEVFDKAIMISRGSLLDMVETVFNLRDLNGSMEIIIVVNRVRKKSNRVLRQLFEHPIERMQIITRRQLQKLLHNAAPPAPAGRELSAREP